MIRVRFGIGETSQHTLEELAQTFGLSKARVQQLESKALRKLRHHVKAWEVWGSAATRTMTLIEV